jgi:hypothetical protein
MRRSPPPKCLILRHSYAVEILGSIERACEISLAYLGLYVFRRHQRYRIVLNIVGRDHMSFHSFWEIVAATGDALQGLLLIYTRLSHNLTISLPPIRKHLNMRRDISMGNIITGDRHAILVVQICEGPAHGASILLLPVIW